MEKKEGGVSSPEQHCLFLVNETGKHLDDEIMRNILFSDCKATIPHEEGES